MISENPQILHEIHKSVIRLSFGKSVSLEDTILKLLNPYLNKWRYIYTNNLYNIVKVASTLLLHKVRVCGTMRSNRGVPNVLRNIKLRHRGTHYKRRGEITIQMWNSKKKSNIQMISDMIDSKKIDRNTQLFIKKPHCIIDYNQYMNGVDLADQYLAYIPICRKALKLTKKIFFYLLHGPVPTVSTASNAPSRIFLLFANQTFMGFLTLSQNLAQFGLHPKTL
uniref:DDE_Tnp_1_7 domain-containing protein n=1 Tax=Glossina pallidipes TaxID=7398 RepID=A0A1A9Z325_GLOPL